MGNDHVLEIVGNDTMKLKIHDGSICTIQEIQYMKGLKKFCLSIGQFDSLYCKIHTNNGIIKIVKRMLVVLKARKIATNLFMLIGETYHKADASIASADFIKDKTMMWHQKLGHMLEKGMKILFYQKLLHGLIKISLPFISIVLQVNNTS
jgi:hypothetical protein